MRAVSTVADDGAVNTVCGPPCASMRVSPLKYADLVEGVEVVGR